MRRRRCSGHRAADRRSTQPGGAGRADRCSSTGRSPRPARCRARPATTRAIAYGPPNDLAVQPGGPTLARPGHARRAVAALPGIHAALCRSARQSRRHQRARSWRRADARRARAHAGRSGAHSAAGRQRDGQQRARRRRRARSQASPYAGDLRAGVRRRRLRERRRAPLPGALEALQAFQLEDAASTRTAASTISTPATRSAARSRRPNSAGFRRLQRSEEGQLLRVPLQRRGPERQRAAVHRLHLRRDRRAAQHGHSANRDPAYYDLGICGRARSPAARRARSTAGCSRRRRCATSPRGRCSSTTARSSRCSDVIRFYNTRDTNPELWYPDR